MFAFVEQRYPTLWPYIQLMRLDRPIGTLLLLWPTLWAVWIAGAGTPSLTVIVVFFLGVVIMRAAGCVINDFADRNFDGDVERTQGRPLATGALSYAEMLPQEVTRIAPMAMLWRCAGDYCSVMIVNS